jgi:hypothetical protein
MNGRQTPFTQSSPGFDFGGKKEYDAESRRPPNGDFLDSFDVKPAQGLAKTNDLFGMLSAERPTTQAFGAVNPMQSVFGNVFSPHGPKNDSVAAWMSDQITTQQGTDALHLDDSERSDEETGGLMA